MASILDKKPRGWTEAEWFDFNIRFELFQGLSSCGDLPTIDGRIAAENLETYFQWVRNGIVPSAQHGTKPRRVA